MSSVTWSNFITDKNKTNRWIVWVTYKESEQFCCRAVVLQDDGGLDQLEKHGGPCRRAVWAQGDDSSPPPLCGLIFFEGDRCLCLTLKFLERLKCYSAKPNESCIIFGIYYFISCLISIVILSLCIFLFLLSFLVRYRVKTMQEKEKMCQTVAWDHNMI